MKNIKFTPNFPVEDIFYPEPAYKAIPDWYKGTASFIDSKIFKAENGIGNQTIKKCVPVFDAMTAGYIIKTYVDVYVEKNEDGPSIFNWPSYNPISFHSIDQAPVYPGQNGMPYPKWINPWSIETSSGYSCLFLPPMHNPNGIFTILPGVVDTDSYINPVNFPFTLNNPNFSGIIKAGTPMAQVIPFKRDSFKHNIGKDSDLKKISKFATFYSNRILNNYKSRFWNKKEYK